MSSEIIVVLVIIAFVFAGVTYLELNSRRNKKNAEQERAITEE